MDECAASVGGIVRYRAKIWIAVVLIALLMGCGSLATEEGMPTVGVTPTASPMLLLSPSPEPTETPTPLPQGGYLVRGTLTDEPTLNPLYCAGQQGCWAAGLLFEGLVWVDAQTGELVGVLADHWTIAEDAREVTFSLRDGLVWSDGEPITSRDVVFTYEALRALSAEQEPVGGVFAPAIAHLDVVEAVDARTVRFRFDRPICDGLGVFTVGLLPAHVLGGMPYEDLWTHPFSEKPTVSSGPFVFGEWVRGNFLTLERNERYWRGAPLLDGVVSLVILDEEALAEALLDGRVDVAEVSPGVWTALEGAGGVRGEALPGDRYVYLAFQMGDPQHPRSRLDEAGHVDAQHGVHPILGNERVRQALAYALDRARMVEEILHGHGDLLEANVLPSLEWAYADGLAPREYDPAHAGELLEQAGWIDGDGDGVRECHGCVGAEEGTPLRLSLLTVEGKARDEVVAELVQEQWGAVGVDLAIEPLGWTAYLERLFGQRFDVALGEWVMSVPEPDDRLLWTSEADRPGEGGNFVSFYSPQVDELFEQVRGVPACGIEERKAIYQEVQFWLHEAQPYIWLYAPRRLFAVNQRVYGVQLGAWEEYIGVERWFVGPGHGG